MTIYSLKRLQKHLITNTDGTECGTFDEFYTTEKIGNEYYISVGISGHEVLLVIYEFINNDADMIRITFCENYIESLV